MHAKILMLLLTLIHLEHVSSFDSTNVVFIILSQSDVYQSRIAKELKRDIERQVEEYEAHRPVVHLTHEDFQVPLSWTIIPMFRPILARYNGTDVRIVVFLEPQTVVSWEILRKTLAVADSQSETMWVGSPLKEKEPIVIHHFKKFKELEGLGGFVYPNFASGFAMKIELIQSVLSHLEQEKSQKIVRKLVIRDAGFELARTIYEEAEGLLLTADPRFCAQQPGDSNHNCATYPVPAEICGRAVPEESIFFAVKTWSGFRQTRAELVKMTWQRYVTNIMFYSDVTDPTLPSIDVGVPNTIRGHCHKTMAILKKVVETVNNMPHVQWIFMVDDDTVFGVQRLCEVLSCYEGGDVFTLLGERHGLSVEDTTEDFPIEYLSLGGGCVFSVKAAAILSQCNCYFADNADDMVISLCASMLNLTLTHSPLFHQERPEVYPKELLDLDRPVSFHHCNSYVYVYEKWFQQADRAMKNSKGQVDEL